MGNTNACIQSSVTQIGKELDNGNSACEKLGQVISMLEDRLSAIKRDAIVFKNDETVQTDKEQIVPLAAEIRNIHTGITICIDRINTLLELIEL